LLKYNQSHVVDSDSDLISMESEASVYSLDSEEEDKEKAQKMKIMKTLLALEADFRGVDCAYRISEKTLVRGVEASE
jgi:hypothetical protein